MVAASRTEIEELTREIENLFQFQDHTNVTLGIYEMKRANILLEAELAEITSRNNFLTEQKSKLEEMIRKELDRIAQEKKERSDRIIAAIKEKLIDDKLQSSLIQKSLEFLSRIPSSKLQANQ